MMGIRRLTILIGLTLLAGAPAQSLLDTVRTNNATSLIGRRFDPWDGPPRGPYAPLSPGDADLGEQRVLTSLEEYQPFNFLLTQQAVWTDNAALTENAELSDFYSNTGLRLSYVPLIAANTFGEISAGYSFYRYSDYSTLDFDDLEASLGLIHVFRDLSDLSIWLRYNYTRLLTARDHSELFTDHSVEFGLYFPISLGPRHLAFGSYRSEFSLDGNPGYASRNEHGITIGHEYKPFDRVSLASYYRIFLNDYRERGRDDLLQDLGIALTTHLTGNIDLVLSASYSWNDSDERGRDYEAGDAGAIISLNIDF
ncbi:MAG: hypothetical protein ACR2RV_27280 [Verrucomicrobiales bacterium]